MRKPTKVWPVVVVSLLLGCVLPAVGEEFYPVELGIPSIFSSSTSDDPALGDLWPVSNLIQGPGVGFDADEPHVGSVNGAENAWVTNANAGFPADYIEDVTAPRIVFDFGAEAPLDEISIWSYSASNSNGVSEFTLRFGLDEPEFDDPNLPTLTFRPQNLFASGDNPARQSFEFGGVIEAQYVEFVATDNFFLPPGDGSGGTVGEFYDDYVELPGGDRAGLGEIAFRIPDEDVNNGPILPTTLPFPSPGDGTWGVREIVNNGVIDSLNAARDSVENGGGTIFNGGFPTLDVTDPDTNPGGGPSLESAPHNFLSNSGGDDDNITTIAKGRIAVAQGGDYTIQVNSDDGFALRIVGKEFDSVTGGFVDLNESSTIARGNAGSTFAQVNLEPGEYDVELMTYENEGQGFYEISSAQGTFTSASDVQWLAVGDSSSLPEIVKPPAILLTEPANVLNGTGVTVEEGVAAVRAKLLDMGEITASGVSDIVALYDPESGNNFGGEATPFPIDTDADDDNFVTAVVGEFILDDGDDVEGETVDITFAIRSDDNGQFRVQGSSFDPDGLFGNAQTAAVDVEGDLACTGDFNSGNIDAVCQISLVEGEHQFEAFHREEGGGAYFQVFWSEGLKTAFSSADFSILQLNDAGTVVPANNGLALVGGGEQVACDFDANGTCDLVDIDALMTDAANGTNTATFDLTGDDVVDQADRDEWLVQAGAKNGLSGAYLLGDADLDGDVDAQDLNEVGISWQNDTVTNWSDGNFVVAQGLGVDANDLNVVGINWQKNVPAAASAVPEPSSALMLLAGLIALSARRRRRS